MTVTKEIYHKGSILAHARSLLFFILFSSKIPLAAFAHTKYASDGPSLVLIYIGGDDI